MEKLRAFEIVCKDIIFSDYLKIKMGFFLLFNDVDLVCGTGYLLLNNFFFCPVLLPFFFTFIVYISVNQSLNDPCVYTYFCTN